MPSRAVRSWATSASAQRFPNSAKSASSFIASILSTSCGPRCPWFAELHLPISDWDRDLTMSQASPSPISVQLVPSEASAPFLASRLSDMQGRPVYELLDVAVERPALDQLQVKISCTLEDRVQSGLTGDHGEERHRRPVDQTGGHQRTVQRQAPVGAQRHFGLLFEPGDGI